jgi:hypothetical protein
MEEAVSWITAQDVYTMHELYSAILCRLAAVFLSRL